MRLSPPFVVVIEGIDLTGKSTISSDLTRELRLAGLRVEHRKHGGFWSANPMRLLAAAFPAPRYPTSKLLTALYLIIGCVEKFSGLRQSREADIVVIESHVDRALTHAAVISLPIAQIIIPISHKLFPAADFAAIAKAGFEVRRARLHARRLPNAIDFLTTANIEMHNKLMGWLSRAMKRHRNLVEVDTTLGDRQVIAVSLSSAVLNCFRATKRRRALLVAIEGSDFSGKSTVANEVVKKLADRGICTRRRTGCVNSVLDSIARYFYGSQLAPWLKSRIFAYTYLLDEVFKRRSLSKSSNLQIVMQESTPHRVLAYADVHGHGFAHRILARQALDVDVLVLLTAPIETRRIRARNSLEASDQYRFGTGLDAHRRQSEALDRRVRATGALCIETHTQTVSETAHAICELIFSIQNSLEACPMIGSADEVTLSWHEDAVAEGLPVRQVYVFIFDSMGRILVQETEDGHNLPGGKPEGSETAEETLERECLEESQVGIVEPTYIGYQLVSIRGRASYAQLRFVARLGVVHPREADPKSGEMYGRRLSKPSEVADLLTWRDTGKKQVQAAYRVARQLGLGDGNMAECEYLL